MAWQRFRDEGIARLGQVARDAVDDGQVAGLSWLVASGSETCAGSAGHLDLDGSRPVAPDTIFRISSMTKPVTAVAALLLVDEGRLGLDDPVDGLLPELADRRVLVDPQGPLDRTVPAPRPISVRDVLTFRLGLGLDFARFGRQPLLDAKSDLGLVAAPPAPAHHPAEDEWLRRLGTLPLEFAPGERWLYHVGAEVLGVLIARAAGCPLAMFLRERLFDPLGMDDTAFWVLPDDLDRFGACFVRDPDAGELTEFDPVDGQWARPPAFCSGADGLVSTVTDFGRFGELLRNRGSFGGHRLLSPELVDALGTNQLSPAQLSTSGPDPSGALGWGLGVGVQVAESGPCAIGSIGWDGGMGSRWFNDPVNDVTAVLLTNELWASPEPPALFGHFTQAVYDALAR